MIRWFIRWFFFNVLNQNSALLWQVAPLMKDLQRNQACVDCGNVVNGYLHFSVPAELSTIIFNFDGKNAAIILFYWEKQKHFSIFLSLSFFYFKHPFIKKKQHIDNDYLYRKLQFSPGTFPTVCVIINRIQITHSHKQRSNQLPTKIQFSCRTVIQYNVPDISVIDTFGLTSEKQREESKVTLGLKR